MNVRKSILNYLILHSSIVRRNHNKSYQKECRQSGSLNWMEKNRKMKSVRPNYFVCIPLSGNKGLVEELIKVQNHVASKFEMLKECAIERNKFHISLLILHVKKSQMVASKEAFREAIEEIKKLNHQAISFDTLETFRNDVLYAGLKEDSRKYVVNMIALLRDAFTKRDIHIFSNHKGKEEAREKTRPSGAIDKGIGNRTDKGAAVPSTYQCSEKEQITPHVTIMKNSYLRKIYANRKPQIFADYYADFNLSKLQTERVVPNKIQFLEMDTDSATSYYRVIDECGLP
ncbi:conserved Plasmodium protein, unknown function [Plasmodium knowlesi strain H]|uniref:A-kinase anchor protein 7-like phosphoesterase domain-containing protein n=3 Tax=Plasmodium knowlesi TaxID=5850 RepID=A0A5K1UEY4_PLAKH|nr:AKAP-like protein, putative [Plasmodium knowlesi strain H]OTN67105.1 Uncharacterized protein PKNOH_S07458200 [Plasmodium knowlesi]CAA9988707.1 AKAP-like protein, putative [Plasmodium knowlesi strain H]SBO21650.1 conserved Plasmodium protein, unknown function [Plasmodium knowlesi strain H]SBO22008.1 conserved Plasmodium protein, unknown function [Plasmodium knowlesi strain H]VVS78181.1 AKAP-like protein, putative [Plasmodium knowlesi strain H]|eukprot:XP_002259684.1 hypothetical protein, conserved in Plasmodium species [Plasmodium knowlesi strain H]